MDVCNCFVSVRAVVATAALQDVKAPTMAAHPGASTPFNRQQASKFCSSSAQGLVALPDFGLTRRYRRRILADFPIMYSGT